MSFSVAVFGMGRVGSCPGQHFKRVAQLLDRYKSECTAFYPTLTSQSYRILIGWGAPEEIIGPGHYACKNRHCSFSLSFFSSLCAIQSVCSIQ